MLGTWFEIALWKRILGALVLGVSVGMIWGPGTESIAWVGTLFILSLIHISEPTRPY